MDWYLYPLIILAGFIAGFINTLAGSGSLVTLPLLMFSGLSPHMANGTNRVAILLQNIVGVNSFHKKGMLDTHGTLYLGAPAVIGSIVGAQLAVGLDEDVMRKAIGAIMVFMLVIIIMRPKRWLTGELAYLEDRPSIFQLTIFFFIGVYGGFIQAGVGIFLLAGLVLGVGYDLVRANAVKVGIVLFFTIFSISVFISKGHVNWLIGLVLAVGNMLGAWLGARVAAEKGAAWVRCLLIVVVSVSAAKLLGVFSWLTSLAEKLL